jgi:hypothetical protein
VLRVNIGQIKTVAQTAGSATVHIDLVYQLKDGKKIVDEKPYIKLSFDEGKGVWLFDDKGPTP